MSSVAPAVPRAALRLAPVGPVAVRTPAFPATLLRDVLTAADGRAALQATFNRDPDLRAVIEIASPSLGAAAAHWLAGPCDADDAVAASLYAYFGRSAMRATPFAACAAVGVARIGDGTPLRCSDMAIRARPDAEWLYAAGDALERDMESFARLGLRPSGLVYQIGGRLEVADVARAEYRRVGAVRSLVPIPTAFNATSAVATLLASCTPGMTVVELARTVAPLLGAAARDVIALIAKLTAVGVFVTEARPALGDRPAQSLARVYARCAPERAAAFASFGATLERAGRVALRDVPSLLAAGTESAKAIATAPHVVQVDASRAYTGAISARMLERLGDAIAKLAELVPQTREPELLARGFRTKYNEGRYVPLLELLDPAEGLQFEALLAVPNPVHERVDAALTEIAMRALAERALEVPLAGDVYATLLTARGERSADFRLPAYVEAIATLRRGAAGELDAALTGYVFEGRSTSLGRFGDLLELDADDAQAGDAIVAEFVGTPHTRRVANVINAQTTTEYVFCCGTSSSRDAEHTIAPADVVVGCEADRLVMRLRHSGKRLRVIFSHRLNAAFASRLASFVQFVSLSDLALVRVPWGSVSGRLPFRPRLTIDGVTVAPAQWCIPAEIARDLSSPPARAWCERWLLPATFEIVETDNRLPIDRESDIARAYLRKIASRVPVVEATEMIPSFADAVVEGPAGAYVAEIAVTYAVRGAPTGAVGAAAERIEAGAALPASAYDSVDALRAPGSEWIFAKLYMGSDRINHFLEREADALRGFAAAADDWHFLRYADPDEHLRVRFRVEEEAARTSLVIDLYTWFNRLIAARSLRRVALDTYDREVERYGGPGRIALAERLFSADSAIVALLLPGLRRHADASAWLAADATSFALALTGSAHDAKGLIRTTLPKRHKLPREAWETVRAARPLLDRERYAAVAAVAREIRAGLPEAVARGVASALLHMHFNRLGIMGAGERYMRLLVAGICEGLLHDK